MPITYGDGGVNRSITSVTYGDGGVNRSIREIWYGDGGVNRLVFAAITLAGLDPTDIVASPTDASATYSLTSAGLEQATGHVNNTWLTIGAASDYDVMLTVNAGSLTSGTTATWLNLGTTRSWNLTRASNVPGTDTCNTTVQIRSASTLVVLASVTVIFTAEVQ